jgi:hypothetical protein
MSHREGVVEYKTGEVHVTLRRDESHACFVITTTHYKDGRRDSTDITCHDYSEPDDAWQEFREAVEAYTGAW